MKKILFFSILLCGTVSAFAQFSAVGARAGFNYTSLHDEMFAEYKPGFHVGGVVNYDFTKELYLQGGVYLTKKGFKSEEVNNMQTRLMDFDAYYIEVPILAALKIKINDKSSIHLNIGPAINIGVFGKGTFDKIYVEPSEDYPNISEEVNTFSDQGFKRFDISAMLGVGYYWKDYSVHFNYDYGFLVVADKNFIGYKDDAKVFTGNNIAFMLSLGYTFGLNKVAE